VLGGAGLMLLGLVGWLRWFSSQRRVAGLEGTKPCSGSPASR
jgi:hypothetical protein